MFVLLKRSIYTVRRVFNMSGIIIVSGGRASQARHRLVRRRQKTQRIKKGTGGVGGAKQTSRKGTQNSPFLQNGWLSSTFQFFLTQQVMPRGCWVQSLCITKGEGGGGAVAGSQIEVWGGGSAPPLPSAEGAISPDWSSYSRSYRSAGTVAGAADV